jgi:carbon-monoxide dehydrogenase small subunit
VEFAERENLMTISFSINGEQTTFDGDRGRLLVHVIRQDLGLTGTKIGCESTVCGACTVLLDGEPVKSCTVLAGQADGRQITTIEGLSSDGLTPVQEGFRAEHAVQCGFCTPGMVVSATALLNRTDTPSDDDVVEALEGNLCRCTGYTSIIRGVHHGAALLRGEAPTPTAGSDIEVPVISIEVERAEIEASDVEVV